MLKLATKRAPYLSKLLEELAVENKVPFFSALSDPLRIKILMLLCWQRNICVTDLAELLKASVPLISHHLRILREAGIITVVRMGQMQCPQIVNKHTKQLLVHLLNKRG